MPPDVSGKSQNVQDLRGLMNCHAPSRVRKFWGTWRKTLLAKSRQQPKRPFPCHRDTKRLDRASPDVSGASHNVQESRNLMNCHNAPSTMRKFWGTWRKKLLARCCQQAVMHLPCHRDTGRLDRPPPDISGASQNAQEARNLMKRHAESMMTLSWVLPGELGWEIRSEFRGIPRLIRFRTF